MSLIDSPIPVFKGGGLRVEFLPLHRFQVIIIIDLIPITHRLLHRRQREMASKEKVEMVELAIQQLMDDQQQTEKRHLACNSSGDGEDNQLLLSTLLSQTMKNDGDSQQADPKTKLPSSTTGEEAENVAVTDDEAGGGDIGRRDEIVKELKKVQRQNFITHCLLSAMIVLTITWQLSEVSLVLKLKDGIDHPFRSVGSLFKRMMKRPKSNSTRNGENQTSSQILAPIQQQIESGSLPSLKIPDVPNFDLGLDNGEG